MMISEEFETGIFGILLLNPDKSNLPYWLWFTEPALGGGGSPNLAHIKQH